MRYNTVLGQSFSSCIKSTDRDRTMLCSNWKKSICDLLSIREILLLFSWKKVSDWKNYLTFNDELTVVQDLFFYNNRIFIPFLERNRVLTEVHARYVGESKCLNRARELVWWPGMTTEMGVGQNMFHMFRTPQGSKCTDDFCSLSRQAMVASCHGFMFNARGGWWVSSYCGLLQ